jgi:hypothetical protein
MTTRTLRALWVVCCCSQQVPLPHYTLSPSLPFSSVSGHPSGTLSRHFTPCEASEIHWNSSERGGAALKWQCLYPASSPGAPPPPHSSFHDEKHLSVEKWLQNSSLDLQLSWLPFVPNTNRRVGGGFGWKFMTLSIARMHNVKL